MNQEVRADHDPRIVAALAELKELIQGRYLMARFEVVEGEDPEGVRLRTIVDLDDPDEVMDLVLERLLALQIDEGLPVYVIPVRTPERIAARLAERKHQRVHAPPLPFQA